MMKNIVSFLVMLFLVFFVSTAPAKEYAIEEYSGQFTLIFTQLDGVQEVYSYSDEAYTAVQYSYENQEHPTIIITIEAGNPFEGQSLDDLSEEELSTLITDLTNGVIAPDVERGTTANGYSYLIANGGSCLNDSCDILFLYNSYWIQVTQYWDDFHMLSQEDQSILIALVDSFLFATEE